MFAPGNDTAAKLSGNSLNGENKTTSENRTIAQDKPSRQALWRKRNPSAYKAHLAVARAVRKGTLVPPPVCECCGKPGRLDAHHPDHTNPLKVRWLLRSCHMREHARMRAGEHGKG